MLTSEQEFISRLQRTQWLGEEELVQYQRPLLEHLIRHAAMHTSFYPERLSPLFSGGDPSVAPFDYARWSSVPVLSRADAVNHVEQMRATEVPPETGIIREGESSGTTGRRLKHARSSAADVVANCMLDRVYELFELDLDAPLAFITINREGQHAFPHGSKAKGWNRTNPNSEVHILNIATPAASQLEWLESVRPAHVMTYPMNLKEVAAIATDRNSAVRFKTFISSGEMLDPSTRETIEQAFGCRTIDVYGVREIGQIAFQCPDAEGYHLCSEGILCELLDERNNPVAPGQYGRVVVTALYNYAMPFVRYDVGDYALASVTPCVCGRGLRSIGGIGGRTRNMAMMPDGSRKRVWGPFFSEAIKYLSYKQVQLIQTAVDLIEVHYVPDDPTVRPDIEGLSELLRHEFHPSFAMRLVPTERIERGAGMKFEQFISRL